MNDQKTHQITELLQRWDQDKSEVVEKVLPLVYHELARLASNKLRMERMGHTLQTGDLVHEAYLRLVDQSRAGWEGRSHFYAIAAVAMRRVLVDHARRHAAQKRIHPQLMVPLESTPEPAVEQDVDVIALDHVLVKLAELDPRQARVVELRAFVGLTLEETAEVLEISTSTVYREWRTAKLWLRRELQKIAASAQDSAGSETDPGDGS